MSPSRRSRLATPEPEDPLDDAVHHGAHDDAAIDEGRPAGRASLLSGLVFSAVGVLLAWLVLTVTFPYSLASMSPDVALFLNPAHPAALVAKAESLRAELFALTDTVAANETPAVVAEPTPDAEGTTGERSARGGAKPTVAAAASQQQEPAAADAETGERAIIRDRLRRDVKELARRALRVDPLNASAYRLLGEVAGDNEEARAMMTEAVRRSRGETVALFWLFRDAISRSEYRAAVGHADILFRTRPEIAALVTSLLAEVVASPAGNGHLVEKLATNPPWREVFLKTLPRALKTAEPGLDLVVGLKSAGAPPTDTEIAPLLDVLIRSNLVEMAYGAWLQLLPEQTTRSLGLLMNPSFETPMNGSPFDWRLSAATNAIAEIVERDDKRKQKALQVSFLTGRSRFSGVEQIVLLGSGEYQMTGVMRGKVVAKRGLKWRIDCLYGQRDMLGLSEPLSGQQDAWQRFTFDFTVPEAQNCRAQKLRLVLDARSPSEELVSGEITIDELKLVRTGDWRPPVSKDGAEVGPREDAKPAVAPPAATSAIRRSR